MTTVELTLDELECTLLINSQVVAVMKWQSRKPMNYRMRVVGEGVETALRTIGVFDELTRHMAEQVAHIMEGRTRSVTKDKVVNGELVRGRGTIRRDPPTIEVIYLQQQAMEWMPYSPESPTERSNILLFPIAGQA